MMSLSAECSARGVLLSVFVCQNVPKIGRTFVKLWARDVMVGVCISI